MNPFQSNEISWDDPILHICSFLPGKDLLNLSEVDKSFNKIITGSKAAMGKIRFVVKVGLNDLQLDDVIEIGEKRQFAALKLVGVNESFAQHVNIAKLFLDSLGSVEDIIIEDCKFKETQFRDIIQAVLPKLKKCELNEVKLTNQEESNDVEPLERCNTNPLEYLTFEDSAGLLKFFEDCNRLKSFARSPSVATDKEALSLNNFLAQQAQLKKLEIFFRGFDWSRLTCFQLEELTTVYLDWHAHDSAEDFSKFLKKLPRLKKLVIYMGSRLSRRLMEAICSTPKLESLNICIRPIPGTPTQAVGDTLVAPGGLFNNTVKTLIIMDQAGVTGCLLKIFRGVESITLSLNFKLVDLSDVGYETIETIELEQCEAFDFQTFLVEFCPAVVPEKVERFESVVLGFAEKCSALVHGIKIGNEAWRNNADFRLTNSFCERLANALPQLEALELYNVADRASFESFLASNRPDLTHFELREPFDDEDFVNKLMNIELN